MSYLTSLSTGHRTEAALENRGWKSSSWKLARVLMIPIANLSIILKFEAEPWCFQQPKVRLVIKGYKENEYIGKWIKQIGYEDEGPCLMGKRNFNLTWLQAWQSSMHKCCYLSPGLWFLSFLSLPFTECSQSILSLCMSMWPFWKD